MNENINIFEAVVPPEGTPERAVYRVMTETLSEFYPERTDLVESYVDRFVNLYQEFRSPSPNQIISIPNDVLTSTQWFEGLLSTSHVGRRVNLDNIGKDFLSFIYHTQTLSESFRRGDSLVQFLTNKGGRTTTLTSLNNSVLRVEALDNYLRIEGYDMRIPHRDESDVFTLFTNPPHRLLSESEVGDPFQWIVETSRFSKLIRGLSVNIQEGQTGLFLKAETPEKYELPHRFRILSSQRRIRDTFGEALTHSLNREFRLWDSFRLCGFPPLRRISESTGIPYGVLLAVSMEENNNPNEYEGLNLLNKIPSRVEDLLRDGLLTRQPKNSLTNTF